MKHKAVFLLASICFTLPSFAEFEEKDPPFPPGWKDTSESINTWDGKIVSKPLKGYSWSVNNAPDFQVIYFENEIAQSSSAGGYMGHHPNASIAISLKDLGTRVGTLNGLPVLWVKRPSPYGFQYKYETVIALEEKTEREPTLKLHFWINIADPADEELWLKWVESFMIER